MGACESLPQDGDSFEPFEVVKESHRHKVKRHVKPYDETLDISPQPNIPLVYLNDGSIPETQHNTPVKSMTRPLSITSIIHWMIEISGYMDGENKGRPHSVSVELCPDGKFSDGDDDPSLVYTQIIGQGGKIAEFLYDAKMKNVSINLSIVPEADNTFSIVQMNGYRFSDLVPEYILSLHPSKILVKRTGGSPHIERPKIASEVVSPGRTLQIQQSPLKTALNWFWMVCVRVSLNGLEKQVFAEISQEREPDPESSKDHHYKQGVASGFGGLISSILHHAKKRGEDLKVTYGLVNGRLVIGSIGDYVLNGTFPDEITLSSMSIKYDPLSVMERIQLPIAVRKAVDRFDKRDSDSAVIFNSVRFDSFKAQPDQLRGKERSQSCDISMEECDQDDRPKTSHQMQYQPFHRSSEPGSTPTNEADVASLFGSSSRINREYGLKEIVVSNQTGSSKGSKQRPSLCQMAQEMGWSKNLSSFLNQSSDHQFRAERHTTQSLDEVLNRESLFGYSLLQHHTISTSPIPSDPFSGSEFISEIRSGLISVETSFSECVSQEIEGVHVTDTKDITVD